MRKTRARRKQEIEIRRNLGRIGISKDEILSKLGVGSPIDSESLLMRQALDSMAELPTEDSKEENEINELDKFIEEAKAEIETIVGDFDYSITKTDSTISDIDFIKQTVIDQNIEIKAGYIMNLTYEGTAESKNYIFINNEWVDESTVEKHTEHVTTCDGEHCCESGECKCKYSKEKEETVGQ